MLTDQSKKKRNQLIKAIQLNRNLQKTTADSENSEERQNKDLYDDKSMGSNLNYYKSSLSKPSMSNYELQWMLKLRRESRNLGRTNARSSLSHKEFPPQWYEDSYKRRKNLHAFSKFHRTSFFNNLIFAVNNVLGDRLNKSVADVTYKGNANDIRHLLKDGLHGFKQVQFESSLRDESNSSHKSSIESIFNESYNIIKDRVRHSKEFWLLPTIQASIDYGTTATFEKQKKQNLKSLLKRISKAELAAKRYNPKLLVKNSNEFRHLVTGMQNTQTLRWETSLQE